MAQFSVHTIVRQTTKGTSGGDKHRGLAGISQGQELVGPPCMLVP